MAVEFLIALFLLTALLSGVAGYALARRGAPKHSDLEALRRDLETAERRAEEVQGNVTGHFEQSAMLFGQLARDYRAFLEHFSESAQALGISEVKARELLARADQPLLGQTDAVIDGESAAAGSGASADSASQERREATGASPAGPAGVAASAAAAEPEPPIIDDVVEPGEKRARVVDVEVDALGLPIEEDDRERASGTGRQS